MTSIVGCIVPGLPENLSQEEWGVPVGPNVSYNRPARIYRDGGASTLRPWARMRMWALGRTIARTHSAWPTVST